MPAIEVTKAADVEIGDVIVTSNGHQRVTDASRNHGLVVLTGVALDGRDPTPRRHLCAEDALVRVVRPTYVPLLESHIETKATVRETKAAWERELQALFDTKNTEELEAQVAKLSAAHAAWRVARDAERIARKATLQEW